MPLKFPGVWRHRPPSDGRFMNESIPEEAVRECLDLIVKLTVQGDRQKVLEHFKRYFCIAAGGSYNWSSNESWADSDLQTYAYEAAENAPLFIEAFHDACSSFSGHDSEAWAPDPATINEIFATHDVGYVIDGPELVLRESEQPLISVASPPPKLAGRAADVLQTSLSRSEQLLSEGRGREAVQESLWLLETVTTAFRGVRTEGGKVDGKYFNRIVRDLRSVSEDGPLKKILEWVTHLHGYLSSPTGGGVRHGVDLDEGVQVGKSEARLFCNLIRSYLSYLVDSHQRLVGS